MALGSVALSSSAARPLQGGSLSTWRLSFAVSIVLAASCAFGRLPGWMMPRRLGTIKVAPGSLFEGVCPGPWKFISQGNPKISSGNLEIS